MAKNSYLGGHTIITPNLGLIGYGKKKKIKPKHLQSLKQAAKAFLNSVIATELNGCEIKKVPKLPFKTLTNAIIKKGGPHQWAQAQEEYEGVKTKLMKRKEKRLERQKVNEPDAIVEPNK